MLLGFPTRQYLLHRVFIRGRFRDSFIPKVQQACPVGCTFPPRCLAVLCSLRAEHSTLVGFGVDHASDQRSSSLLHFVYGSHKLLATFYIQAGKYLTGIAFYVCYQLWRHNGGWCFSHRFGLVVKADGFSKADTARASRFSACSEQFIQHIIQHGQVRWPCGDQKADSWVLGCTHGLVSLTPTRALHVPTRRVTLLESYFGAFRFTLTRHALLTISTTVLLPCHRKISAVSRRLGHH